MPGVEFLVFFDSAPVEVPPLALSSVTRRQGRPRKSQSCGIPQEGVKRDRERAADRGGEVLLHNSGCGITSPLLLFVGRKVDDVEADE
jgi:hypothetical protein